MAEDQGGAGDVGRLVAHAGRDAMIAGRDLTINNLFQGMPPAAARSAYLEQVRRIAPPDPPGLSDRDTELAELASFCLAPEGASYVWLRAGPWAGKSALLSTFVLRPPSEVAQRVRIVSFFITARLAAQDTRESFIQVLLEQLAALLGQSLPAVLPEATQEAYLLGLLSQAASDCKETGKRLVLVVDGLDEDRGVTTGPQAHSIAGLLPARPLDEMRVIVAGRPNPPIPDDVPDWHPLRDPAIIRPLSDSPYARDVQRLARQELQRLLHGSQAEQDVLGLLTAARGGLTARDLADLAGAPLWVIEDILHTIAGRTLQGRPSLLNVKGAEVYLLGHEELQAAATDYLGVRLSGYRDRLHAWAGLYRTRRWPAETPEYLLTGYFRLLDDLGDIPQMANLAADVARHDRMLDLTGGDAAALTEARTTLDRIAASDHPDLASALALACHRDRLANRNARIPPGLPAVWVTLGQLSRAEALARSITDPDRQLRTLAEMAGALARAGQYQQAEAIATHAEAVARSITDPPSRSIALIEVAGALGRAGQYQQAEALARSITDPGPQAGALVEVAGALARAGRHRQAEALARSITDPDCQPRALTEVAEALARAGRHRQAEALARSITDPDCRPRALARVAVGLARAGRHQLAAALAMEAKAATDSILDPELEEEAVAEVAGALAWAGQAQQAEALARSITDSYWQTHALTEVAGALARTGQAQQAEAIATHAEAAARSITNPHSQAYALAQVAGALGRAGQYQQAEAIITQAEAQARSITDPYSRTHALADVARVLGRAGQYQQAEAIAKRAEVLARSIASTSSQAKALASVAEALAQGGQYQQAEAIAKRAEVLARSITDRNSRSFALVDVAEAMARAGQYQQAEALARSIPGAYGPERALVEVAGAMARAGQYQQAEALARSITGTYSQAEALAKVAEAMARAGQYQQAEVLAHSITASYLQRRDLVEVAGAMARAGQYQQAEALARSISGGLQADALAQVAEALVRAGEAGYASRLAAATCAIGQWTTAVGPVLLLTPPACAQLVRAMAEQQ